MDILNKPINTFKFEEIVAFCKEGIPEGFQIDYKREIPSKGLAKHFASFSNTRGGVIIIGVEENKKSGTPSSWEGVVKDAKLIERIHQEASNVEPIPSYGIYATDAVNGKCFILIRVNEGDKTPYYVQNDSNVWVRTGNITNQIDIASPDGLELLFGKRGKSEKLRDLYLKKAEDIFDAGLEREEKIRQYKIREAEKRKEKTDNHFQHQLGSNVILCTIAVQPYFPYKSLTTPKEIKSQINNLRIGQGYYEFPDYNMEPIPEGLFHFFHNFDGYIECQQIFSQGMIYNNHDISRFTQDGRKVVFISFIAGKIYNIFQFARGFYNQFGYQGVLDGSIMLKNMKDVFVSQIKPSRWIFHDNDKQSFLSNYNWKIQIDTNLLNNKERLIEWYYSLVGDIYWSLGFSEAKKEIINEFLKEVGLI